MDTTLDAVTGYEKSADFPKLFWAAVILCVINGLVIVGILFSPSLPVAMYGAEKTFGAVAGRPSPFAQVVSEQALPVYPAARLRPVLLQEVPSTLKVDLGAPKMSDVPLFRPAAYRPPIANANILDVPRISPSSVDASPRRTSEREQRPVISH